MRPQNQCGFLTTPVSLMITHPQKMGRRWKQYWPAKWSLFVRQLFEINNPHSWSTGSTKGILADDTDLFITWYTYRGSSIYRQKTILISHYMHFSISFCLPLLYFLLMKGGLLSEGVYIRIIFYYFVPHKTKERRVYMITVDITLCWVMTPCNLDTTYQSFGQHFFLHRTIK